MSMQLAFLIIAVAYLAPHAEKSQAIKASWTFLSMSLSALLMDLFT
jgi:hypothetical protein